MLLSREFFKINKTTAKFIKKAARLLNEAKVDHSLTQECLTVTLSEKCSRKAFWHTFRVLSLAFKAKERGEDVYFSGVFDGEAYWKCGCEVEGFSSHFEEDYLWSYDYAMHLINECICKVYTEGGEMTFQIDYKRFTVSMKVVYSEICEDCLENKKYVEKLKETMRPDTLLQGSIYSHGLATGFGVNEVSAEKAEENLKTLLNLVGSDKEICCSWKNQQIGGFGLFIKGEVTIASNRDLWSYVGEDGFREFDVDEYWHYIIDKKEDLNFEVWDHTEFFVRPKKVVAFWAKDWFVKRVPGGREFVEELRRMGHKVYITRCRHR